MCKIRKNWPIFSNSIGKLKKKFEKTISLLVNLTTTSIAKHAPTLTKVNNISYSAGAVVSVIVVSVVTCPSGFSVTTSVTVVWWPSASATTVSVTTWPSSTT